MRTQTRRHRVGWWDTLAIVGMLIAAAPVLAQSLTNGELDTCSGSDPSNWTVTSTGNINSRGCDPGTSYSGSASYKVSFWNQSAQGWFEAYQQITGVPIESTVTLTAWLRASHNTAWYAEGRIGLYNGANTSWDNNLTAPNWSGSSWLRCCTGTGCNNDYGTCDTWVQRSTTIRARSTTVTAWLKAQGQWGDLWFDKVELTITPPGNGAFQMGTKDYVVIAAVHYKNYYDDAAAGRWFNDLDHLRSSSDANQSVCDTSYVDYDIDFTTTGSFYIKVLRSAANTSSNSASATIGGGACATVDNDGNVSSSWQWRRSGSTWSVASTGVKTLRFYRREANYEVAQIWVGKTLGAPYEPTDGNSTEWVESPRAVRTAAAFTNGGFETGGVLYQSPPNEWTAVEYVLTGLVPTALDWAAGGSYAYEGNVRTGSVQALFGNYTGDGGLQGRSYLFQRVTVTAGTTYDLSAYYTAKLSGAVDQSRLVFRIGLDPTGGTDWGAASVTKSSVVTFSGKTSDQWYNLTASAAATGSTMTVFLYAGTDTAGAPGGTYWILKYDDVTFQAQAATVRPTVSNVSTGSYGDGTNSVHTYTLTDPDTSSGLTITPQYRLSDQFSTGSAPDTTKQWQTHVAFDSLAISGGVLNVDGNGDGWDNNLSSGSRIGYRHFLKANANRNMSVRARIDLAAETNSSTWNYVGLYVREWRVGTSNNDDSYIFVGSEEYDNTNTTWPRIKAHRRSTGCGSGGTFLKASGAAQSATYNGYVYYRIDWNTTTQRFSAYWSTDGSTWNGPTWATGVEGDWGSTDVANLPFCEMTNSLGFEVGIATQNNGIGSVEFFEDTEWTTASNDTGVGDGINSLSPGSRTFAWDVEANLALGSTLAVSDAYLKITPSDGQAGTAGTSSAFALPISCSPPLAPSAGPTAVANSTSQITWGVSTVSGLASEVYRFYDQSSSGTVKATTSTHASTGVENWTAVESTGLTANTSYTRYAATYLNCESTGTRLTVGPRYTLIEAVTGLTFGTTTTTSIQVQSTNTPSNLTAGSSGLLFTNTTTSATSGWQQNNNYWTNNTGLTANTSYNYTGQSRNGDSATTTAFGPSAKATRIETPPVPTFGTVTASSIVVNFTGSYTNLTSTNSGLRAYNQTTSADSGSWQQATTPAWTNSSDLSPNTQYTYRIDSRNRESVVQTGPTATKYTLANIPGTPTVGTPTSTSLTVTINANSNPAGTRYAISTDSGTNWVQFASLPVPNTNGIGASVGTGTTYIWTTNTTVVVNGLTCGTSYTFKVKAINGEDVQTDLGSPSTATSTSTCNTAPSITAGPSGVFNDGTNVQWNYTLKDDQSDTCSIATAFRLADQFNGTSLIIGAANTDTWKPVVNFSTTPSISGGLLNCVSTADQWWDSNSCAGSRMRFRPMCRVGVGSFSVRAKVTVNLAANSTNDWGMLGIYVKQGIDNTNGSDDYIFIGTEKFSNSTTKSWPRIKAQADGTNGGFLKASGKVTDTTTDDETWYRIDFNGGTDISTSRFTAYWSADGTTWNNTWPRGAMNNDTCPTSGDDGNQNGYADRCFSGSRKYTYETGFTGLNNSTAFEVGIAAQTKVTGTIDYFEDTTWHPATRDGSLGDAPTGLTSSPSGTAHTFVWDSDGNIGTASMKVPNAYFSITPSDPYTAGSAAESASTALPIPCTPPNPATSPGPQSPIVSGVTATSITWTWSDSSNETGYKVYADSGASDPTTLRTTTAANATSYTGYTGLGVNTQHSFQVAATNGYCDSTKTTKLTRYTLANAPGSPVTSAVGSTALRLNLNTTSNPASTQFALYDNTTAKYLTQPSGTPLVSTPTSSSEVWLTAAQWGTTILVSGLTPNTSYTFKAKARNGDNIETVFSENSTAAATLAAEWLGSHFNSGLEPENWRVPGSTSYTFTGVGTGSSIPSYRMVFNQSDSYIFTGSESVQTDASESLNLALGVNYLHVWGLNSTSTGYFRIQAEEYTPTPVFGSCTGNIAGTNNTDFYDSGSTNDGGSTYRGSGNTYVDIRTTADGDSACNLVIGWISQGEWQRYDFPYPGYWQIMARAGGPIGTPGTLRFQVDALTSADISVGNTGGYDTMAFFGGSLNAGTSPQYLKATVQAVNGGFDYNWYDFRRANRFVLPADNNIKAINNGGMESFASGVATGWTSYNAVTSGGTWSPTFSADTLYPNFYSADGALYSGPTSQRIAGVSTTGQPGTSKFGAAGLRQTTVTTAGSIYMLVGYIDNYNTSLTFPSATNRYYFNFGLDPSGSTTVATPATSNTYTPTAGTRWFAAGAAMPDGGTINSSGNGGYNRCTAAFGATGTSMSMWAGALVDGNGNIVNDLVYSIDSVRLYEFSNTVQGALQR